MTLARKVLNGLLLVAFLGIIAGMIAWGIIAHNDHKKTEKADHRAEEHSMEIEDTNNGHIKGCHGPGWKCSLRLDPAVIPLHYEIHLNPDFKTGLFQGRVKITLNITKDVEHIRLHIKDLDILNTSITGNGSIPHNITAFHYGENEFWVIDHTTSNEMFKSGRYILEIKFQGDMTKKIVGIYRSSYFDRASNETRYVVSTKFQPTYARRAFPCFDEPGLKSTFALRVVRPRNLTCISNMPIYSEELNTPEPGYTTVFFEKSVPMVTYLVAFAIGDFEYKTGTTSRGLPVRVYATKSLVPSVDYAAKIAPRIVDFFEDYFKTDYPLPKLDIIGIPEFISGAMEHWGMISFRESNLIYTPGVSSAYNKKRVAAVISHEIAHMWFGNLVTLKWWNDLWLNEGFASYMEYKGVDRVHPEWKINWQFLADDFADTLRLDARKSSHPIVQAVAHPNQITELFDTISYSKGATIIRMLEDFMGADLFRNGVEKFLKKYSFKNAVTADLWTSLQQEVNNSVNIDLVMSTWTKQMGYPLVTINTMGNAIRLTQQRFHESPQHKIKYPDGTQAPLINDSMPSPYNYSWELPVKIEFGNEEGPQFTKLYWMHHQTRQIVIEVSENYTWFKVNPGYAGLYRVKYNDTMVRNIKSNFLKHWTIPDKCGLSRDLFALANGNYSDFAVALEFAQVLEGELEFLLWDCVDGHLRKIARLLRKANPPVYVGFQKYMQKLLAKSYRSLEWKDVEEEDIMKRMIKPKIIALACEFEVAKCRDSAATLMNLGLQSPGKVPGSLRDVIYKWGMYTADGKTWQKVWDRYINEQDPQERVRLLRALASIQSTDLIKRLLELAQDEKNVRRQDYFGVIKYISQNPMGSKIVWDFYRKGYEKLAERFGTDNRYFGRVIQDVTADFSTLEELQEVYDLFSRFPDGGAGTNSRKYAIEHINNNIHWRSDHASKVEEWLHKHV